jgi:glycosyltransferase involved in cell wall biosynthesis
MRIVHAISTLAASAGGPPIAVVAMARAMALRGHEVAIVTADHAMSDEEKQLLAALQWKNLRIDIHRHLPPAALTRHASFSTWPALMREIAAADVVHLHSLYGFHDLVAWRACRRFGVPYILRPHGTLHPFVRRHHRRRKLIADLLFQNRVIRDATLISFTAESERDAALPYIFGVPSVVVPTRFDLDGLAQLPPASVFRAAYPEIRERRIVLFLGRLNYKKGIEILIPAFAAAASRGADIHLVLAGPDGGFAAEARDLVDRWGIGDRTTFTGQLSRGEVAEALAAADLFALPSHTENFGIAAAEAMAAGVPTLLSDEVDVGRDAARNAACRVVSRSISAWTDAISGLLADPVAARAMGARARSYAFDAFSWSGVAEKLVAMYEEAIALGKARIRQGGLPSGMVGGAAAPAAANSRSAEPVTNGSGTTRREAPERLRILHVISTLAPAAGGPPVAVLAMARTVAALGHDVAVHAADHAMSKELVRALISKSEGSLSMVVHRHLPPAGLTRHASLGLWRALSEEIPQADIVHLHSLYGFHDWAVWRLCRRAGVPYLLQPHGTLDPFIIRHHRRRKRILDLMFQDEVTRDARSILYTSETERDLAEPYVFGRPGVVIPLGVDLERYAALPPAADFRARHPEIGNRRIVLFLGRLNFKKGIELLIPAFAEALSRCDDLHLVFAGGDGGFGATARAMVKLHRLGDRTTFTGHLDAAEVAEAFAAASLFVLPSRTENFAIAAAEAMAAGVPSILSDQVQIAAAAARQGACRVALLAVPDWTNAMLELLEAPDAAAAMGRRARSYAQANFAWPRIAEQLVERYRDLVGAG